VFSDELKIVRTFGRARRAGNWVGSEAYLNCGNDDFGFNHLSSSSHVGQWQAKAERAGASNWRHAADFGIYGATKYPQYVTHNSTKDTYCMARWIYVNEGAETVNKFKAQVIVSSTGRRIISAYPSKSWCSLAGSIAIFDDRP
jgi:hypothetical protein